MTEEAFQVTILAKVAHARLLALAEERGGVPALAKEIGVSDQTLRAWVYMRTMPGCGKVQKNGRKQPNRKTTQEAVRRLCELAEASPEELFPGFVRERLNGKAHTLRATVEVGTEQLTGDVQKQITYDVPWESVDTQMEAMEKLPELLKTITSREREIIKFRYGMTDGRAHTLPETAAVFKVTVERVRQIEQRALRRLTSSARRTWPGEFWNEDNEAEF